MMIIILLLLIIIVIIITGGCKRKSLFVVQTRIRTPGTPSLDQRFDTPRPDSCQHSFDQRSQGAVEDGQLTTWHAHSMASRKKPHMWRVDCQHRCSIVHSNHVCDCGRCHGDCIRAQDCEVCGALEYILLLSNNFRDVWTNKRSRPLLPGWTRSPNNWLHWRCEGNRTSTSAYFGDHPTVQFYFVPWQLCCCIMWETTLVVLSRISPSTIICNTFRN